MHVCIEPNASKHTHPPTHTHRRGGGTARASGSGTNAPLCTKTDG